MKNGILILALFLTSSFLCAMQTTHTPVAISFTNESNHPLVIAIVDSETREVLVSTHLTFNKSSLNHDMATISIPATHVKSSADIIAYVIDNPQYGYRIPCVTQNLQIEKSSTNDHFFVLKLKPSHEITLTSACLSPILVLAQYYKEAKINILNKILIETLHFQESKQIAPKITDKGCISLTIWTLRNAEPILKNISLENLNNGILHLHVIENSADNNNNNLNVICTNINFQ